MTTTTIDATGVLAEQISLMLDDQDYWPDLVEEQTYRIVQDGVPGDAVTDTAEALWVEHIVRDVLPEVEIRMGEDGFKATDLWMPSAYRVDVTFVDDAGTSIVHTVSLVAE